MAVLVITAALIIFFGAWAASAGAEGRELNFGFVSGTGATGSSATTDEGGQQSQAAFGAAPIGESSEDVSLTWWGQGFLKACPLH